MSGAAPCRLSRSSEPHRLLCLGECLRGFRARTRCAVPEDLFNDVRAFFELAPPRLDRLELGEHVLDHHLLAVEAADARRAAALRELGFFLVRAVDLVQPERRTILRI